MKKDILITISDSHTIDGNKEAYEMTTRGSFQGDANHYVIEYDEQYDELKGCHTVMTVKERKCVEIVRTGSYNSELCIERGKRHNCQYNTPFGSMVMGITAQKVKSTVDEGNGIIELQYTVDFYGGVTNETNMKITISC